MDFLQAFVPQGHGQPWTPGMLWVAAAAGIVAAVATWRALRRLGAAAVSGPDAAADEPLPAPAAETERLRASLESQVRELTASRDAAFQRVHRAKRDLLASVSHQLRTPLNAVIGLSESLLGTALSEPQREHVRTILEAGEELLGVIDDLLDFSNVETGRVRVERVERVAFDLEDALGDTLRSFSAPAARKGLELACQIAADVPRRLIGDPRRLRQVLTQLVANAIAHTEAGEVVVRVQRESIASGLLLRIAVEDTGIGIEPGEAERLFESRGRSDGAGPPRHEDGLGLGIARGLVQLLGGHIGVQSSPGRGSRFFFTARFEASGSAAPAPERAAIEGARVLLVDDSATQRAILGDVLRRHRVQVVEAASAAEALARFEQSGAAGEAIVLLLCDAHLPGADAFGLAERIRAHAEGRRVAIVLLSPTGSDSERERCRELRIAARLMKPVKESELLGALARALAPSDPEPARGSERSASAGSREERAGSGAIRPLRILLVEDSPANQKVARTILESRGHAVAVADDGQEALGALSLDAFDVVLMDAELPLMDGFECTAAIRAAERETGAHLPIIAMTAHALHGDRERCLAAGMDDYVAKPIRREELFRALAKAVPTRESRVNRSRGARLGSA